MGNFSTELTLGISFFTENNDFFNGKHLKKSPVYGTDFNLIYNIKPGLWCSASAAYSSGGKTAVNGVSSDNREASVAWALSLGLPIKRGVGVLLSYIETRTQAKTGFDSDTFRLAFSVAW